MVRASHVSDFPNFYSMGLRFQLDLTAQGSREQLPAAEPDLVVGRGGRLGLLLLLGPLLLLLARLLSLF